MATDPKSLDSAGRAARALENCLISPNETDKNGEASNVVDGLYEIARAIRYLADKIDKSDAPFAIARALNHLAETVPFAGSKDAPR